MRENPNYHTVYDTKKEGCEGHGAPTVCLAHRDPDLPDLPHSLRHTSRFTTQFTT